MTIDLRKPQHHAPAHAPRISDAVRERMQPAEEMQHVRSRAPKRKQERAVMLFAAAVIAVLVLVAAAYGATRTWGHFFGGSEYEVRSLVADVGELMLLPDDESPTLATVTDLHALEGQLFFKYAEEGDKVLMYLRSQKAILYRPSIHKIIEVGPITGAQQ